VLVVGGGDTAIEDALVLARTSKTVRVVHRRGELRASGAMQERAKQTPNLSFVWHSVVEECLDSGTAGSRGRGSGTCAQARRRS